jgi:prepilin-type N-terminal cleavage/methylation domain-containing protein
MKQIKTHPKGFTLVEIMIVVAIIGMLAVVAIPNFVKARATAQKQVCINNLSKIKGAVQEWALENRKAPSDGISIEDCKPYLSGSVTCPAGGTTMADSYSVSDCQTDPTCISRGGGAGNGHALPPGP